GASAGRSTAKRSDATMPARVLTHRLWVQPPRDATRGCRARQQGERPWSAGPPCQPMRCTRSRARLRDGPERRRGSRTGTEHMAETRNRDDAAAELAALLLSTDSFDELLHGVTVLSVRLVAATTTASITLAERGRVLT